MTRDKFCPQCGTYHWKYQQLAMVDSNDIISIQECKCGWVEERTDWEAIRKDKEKIALRYYLAI